MRIDLPYRKKKAVSQLIDPDKYDDRSLNETVAYALNAGIDFFLAGGSLTGQPVSRLISMLKSLSDKPVILFPGNLVQLTTNADAVFLLSLISGRNPELLIGNHVIAAPFLREIRDNVIPVGYLLVDCGGHTSVEYMSQTSPVPYDKNDIAVATALAGEMLGMKAIYLEGGSGASHPVNPEMIKAVRDEIRIPLITGGGIREASMADEAFSAGADMIVIGNGAEKSNRVISEVCRIRDKYNRTSFNL